MSPDETVFGFMTAFGIPLLSVALPDLGFHRSAITATGCTEARELRQSLE